jgi:hypothetical protein
MIALSERNRRLLILVCILAIAGLLAFPLRDAVYRAIVIPAAFIAWHLNLWYRSLSQDIWWWVILFIVLIMLSYSLVPQVSFRRRSAVKTDPAQGQVEGLALALQKAERGIYFKWLVANRLGKLAYQMLLHRESGRPRSFLAPLVGPGWEPSPELRTYLETGLHGSFADFPHATRPLGEPPKTPLDFEVARAVEFLEAQIENGKRP